MMIKKGRGGIKGMRFKQSERWESREGGREGLITLRMFVVSCSSDRLDDE